jgi:uncharacterized linocin/CFP29 family protein
MATTVNRAGFWNDQVWSSIDDGVTKSVLAIRVAQKVFPVTQLSGVTSVPADHFNPEKMSIAEGLTRPYVELAVEFSLTNGQVNADPAGATAITLSKLAAKALALGEDMVILQGKDATLPSSVRIESGGESIGNGILGLESARTILVKPPDPNAPTNSGGEILAAISKGIATLTKDQQAPPYALIEDTNAFAATWGSVINGAPAYTVLNPVLTGGIFGTGAMRPNTGLLIALGGDPTTIYSGIDATTEPTHKAGAGQYNFRTYERVQFVARDHRAFVKLDFSYLANVEPSKKE